LETRKVLEQADALVDAAEQSTTIAQSVNATSSGVSTLTSGLVTDTEQFLALVRA
jgi:hypothetical protein